VKAVWYERTGPAPEVLTYGDMPTPAAGAGEVRVRLEASGVNPADVGRRGGSYRAMEYPRVIPNSDGAGIVDQLGDGVTRLKLGQRCSTTSATAAPSAPRPNILRLPSIW
jgi:NADPH:quinone reductase